VTHTHLHEGPFTFQFRRGLVSDWTAENPILHAGEPGLETDTGKLKLGDGVHAWADLGYYPPNTLVSGVASVDGRSGVVTLTDLYAAHTHVHAESDVTNLVTDLSDLTTAVAGKAATGHIHAESDVTNLVTDLAGKAASSHTHAASDVNSGILAIGRIPTGTSGSTVALGNHTHPFNPAPVDLTDGATIGTDASLGTHFRVVLGGDRTLSNPSGMIDGQKCLWEIVQDATGTRLLTLGSAFIFGADITEVVLSTAANKRDLMGAIYNASLAKWLVVAFTKGF
jgi:major tropism determinant Mtd-like protein/tail-like repeat protein